MSNIIPWKHRKTDLPARRNEPDAYTVLHRQMSDLFEWFFHAWEHPFASSADRTPVAAGVYVPSVDVAETDDEVQVTADLPGMTEKDVEVSLDEQTLTLRGEKHADREERKKNWHMVERSYGAFQRTVSLPRGIDAGKIKANFKNGVLTVHLPKTPEAKARKRMIAIESD